MFLAKRRLFLLLQTSWIDVKVALEGGHPAWWNPDILATGWTRETSVRMVLHQTLETSLAEGVRTGQQLGPLEGLEAHRTSPGGLF